MKTDANLSGQCEAPRRGVGPCRAVLSLALTLSLAACVSPPAPQAQLAGSTWAVASAANAGGGEAAPDDMRMARDKLALAGASLSAGQYDMARWLAEQAEVDAQLAGVKARTAGASKPAPEAPRAHRVVPGSTGLEPLEQARSDVRSALQTALGNPQTTERAAAELERSLDALTRADVALARGGDAAEVEHWAYMARQHAAIAQEISRQGSADNTSIR